MFYATIKRNSVSLLKFFFLSPVLMFWYEVSSVCRLKYPYSCFSSHFCLLFCIVYPFALILQLILLADLGKLFFLFFLMHSSRPYVDKCTQSSIFASPLSPSYLDTYEKPSDFCTKKGFIFGAKIRHEKLKCCTCIFPFIE